MRKQSVLRVLMLFTAGCASSKAPSTVSPPQGESSPATTAGAATRVAPTAAAEGSADGIDMSALDRTVQPCQDFYQFACGGWMARTEIPADRPAWSRGFSEITEQTLEALKESLEAAAQGAQDPTTQKLGHFYATCMDEAQAEAGSRQTLDSVLERIAGLQSRHELAPLVADLQLAGMDALFEFGAIQDFKDAQQMIAGADQGGLGLPDRDYYLKKDAASRKILAAYQEHVARMFELVGQPAAKAAMAARTVISLETKLARSSMDKVLRRQPEKIYHRLDRKGLVALAPAFDWSAYFAALGRAQIEAINVMSPDFFRGLQRLLTTTKVQDLQLYLQWHALSAAAPALSPQFVNEAFRMQQVLSGEEALLPRWKRCLAAVEEGMGQALGKSFVERTFSAEAKSRSLDVVHAIEAAFRHNLAGLTWMDEATRAAAAEKLERVYNKIGYPETWRSYAALEITRTSDLANRCASSAFETRRDLAKIGQPIDRSEWHMSPHTVNAYYDPLMNEMVFPAGILQPPFFDPARSKAENFGAAGMVMGHELTHGFDDEGRKFDAVGNLRNWWSEAAGKQFETRTKCVVKQYSAYAVAPDLKINGELTLGENIADIGGLKLAHEAWKSETHPQGIVDGFSAEQRFFIAFAQSWCTKRRDAYARMLVGVDPHSPPQFRVNGTVTSHPGFASAFSCPAGSPMAPQTRCEVW